MTFTLLTPFLYLLLGMVLGRTRWEIKGVASALLTQWVIPAVIVYNIATQQPGVMVMVAGMMAIMSLMLLLARALGWEPVKSLCFWYLNIGWLGLPIASSLFGSGAATLLIAAYVGNSMFGNAIGVGLLAEGQRWQTRLWHTLRAPPVWALLLGVLCLPLGAPLAHYGAPLYALCKWLMGLLGMMILGLWLARIRLRRGDFHQAAQLFLLRALCMALLISGLIGLCRLGGVALVLANQPALYLMALLPPAANIIVLETYYLKSGRSASMIASGTVISVLAIGLYALLLAG